MPEATSPNQGTAEGDVPLSFDEGADAISNLVDDSDSPNLAEQVEAKDADMPEGDDAQDDQDEDPDQAEDGPDAASKGQFVSADAKVRLKDGTVITVEDLKRGFMSQQSFTRSSTEVAEERKALKAQKEQTGQIAQSLAQQRDFLLSVAQAVLPKAPDRAAMADDPYSYMVAKAEYDERMQMINQLAFQQQAEKQRQAGESDEQAQERRAEESRKLIEAMPEFRDRKVYDQFWGDATETAAHYGYTAQEWAELANDHRIYPAMRDLMKYRKALQKAPQVKQDIQAKPKLMQGGRRMDPKQRTSRDAQTRVERLRQTGSFEDGVAALMDLS